MEMARLEREAQREAAQARERAEAEARQLAEAERQRQHALTMREMEISKERDREHAERMVQMTKNQQSGGLGQIGEVLGMDTPELLQRIFGGGGDDKGGGWADAVPKILGSMADVGKAVLAGKAAPGPAEPRRSKPARRAITRSILTTMIICSPPTNCWPDAPASMPSYRAIRRYFRPRQWPSCRPACASSPTIPSAPIIVIWRR